jgi:hypothetical protein
MKKVLVRFPNESEYQELIINLDNFEKKNEFGDEIFGWYDGTYIAIKKDTLS